MPAALLHGAPMQQSIAIKIHAALQSSGTDARQPMGVLLTPEEREAIVAISKESSDPRYVRAYTHVIRDAVRLYLRAYTATRP